MIAQHESMKSSGRLAVFLSTLAGLRGAFRQRPVDSGDWVRLSVTILGLALIYFATARFGLLFAISGGHVTPTWLPSGVALAAVMLLGWWVTPGIWLGSFCANLWDFLLGSERVGLMTSLVAAGSIGFGASLTAVAGASFIKRLVGDRNPLERVRDVFLLLSMGGVASCLISASIGTTTLCLAEKMPWSRFAESMATWWIGDIFGVFVVTPFVLAWTVASNFKITALWPERVCCFGLLGLLSYLIFIDRPIVPFGIVLTPFMLLPLVLWAAVRTGSRGSVVAVVIISLVAVWGTIYAGGPSTWVRLSNPLLMLDLYVSANVITALCMSAVVTQQQQAELLLMTANVELEQRVHDRTIRLNLVVDRLQREMIERQMVQEQLADREASLIDAQEIGEFGSYEVDVTTWIGRCSPTACKIYGIHNEEPFRDFRAFVKQYVHPADIQRVNQTRQTLLETGMTDEIELRFLRPDGRETILYGRRRAVRNPNGRVVKIVGIVQDITERKLVENRLRASEARFATIFRASPVGICITTLEEGKYLDVNDAFCNLIGQTRQELMGRKSLDLGHWINPVDRTKLVQLLKQTGSLHNLEGEFRRKDGSIGYSLRSLERLTLDGEDCLLTLFDDITESKRASAELHTSRQRLEVLSRQLITTQEMERRHIARELHDELGQVLTAMKIHLWSTQQTVDANVRARFDESLAMIDRAIGQVRNLSLNLRPPQLEDLGLVAALHWYLRKQSEIAGFQQHLVADPAEMQVPIELATTCFRITQEAVTNALRHAKPREIHVELFQSDQELHLTIQDDGNGFDVNEAHQRASRGECLGLSGMQERVHLADGHLEIDSSLTAGTTIHAWFPLSPLLLERA